jgi:uncharacterized protein YndB with AHSA1/START domain
LLPGNKFTDLRFVENTVTIAKAPEVVLEAFTSPKDLQAWWGVNRSLIELKKGGLYSLLWQNTDNAIDFVSTGIIAEYIPGCQLKIENMVYLNPRRPVFGPMELIVLTTPEKIGTTLTVVQSGYQNGKDWDWYYDIVKETWPTITLKIKEYLENKTD